MNDKMLDLARYLTEKTANENVKWNEFSETTATEFFAKIGKMSVVVMSAHDDDTEQFGFAFKLIDESKQTAGSVLAYHGDDGYSVLENLFGSALANARNLSGAIDRIKETLNSVSTHRKI